MKTDRLDIRNMDCMEMMKEFPDNHFDLAVVDPPYGIGGNKNTTGKHKKINWDENTPAQSFFDELFRVSRERIIWGANYFPGLEGGRIVWNKLGCDIGRRNQASTQSDCELAYCSIGKRIKMFSYTQIGNVEGNDYQVNWTSRRIHPTQKPVALYNWIFANYAEEGMKILDTHMGSGSIAIAAHYAKMHLVACELDGDYYKAACERIDKETRQIELF